MDQIHFLEIPESYQLLKNQINNYLIKKVYSLFKFLYFPYTNIFTKVKKYQINSINTNYNIENFIFDYLADFKLIVYQYTNINQNNTKNINIKECNQYYSAQNIDIIIVVEKECIIITDIDYNFIKKIFEKLQRKKISIINLSKTRNSKLLSNEEHDIITEIQSFCSFVQINNNNNNLFIINTISPIICYSIRKYFYPTYYFKDPSFFDFNGYNKSQEIDIKKIFENYLFGVDTYQNIDEINQKLINDSHEVNYNKFYENDFIKLRRLYSNTTASFYLVMHRESLHIFMLKCIEYPELNTKEMKHEIDFCEKYSHRCLVPFYGFLYKKEIKSGFLYEFMPNGTLLDYIESRNDKNDVFSLMTINRLFQGIMFFQSNSLIHRDFKPSNILLDHDYVPYISDFETIRQVNCKNDNENITNNIGSPLYTSPEQEQGKLISFPTDIYSFGLIIFFLITKKHLKNEENHQLINNCSSNIQYLFMNCTKYSQSERLSVHEIKKIIMDENDSFYYFEQFLLIETISKFEFIQFLLEGLFINQQNKLKYGEKFYYNIIILNNIYKKTTNIKCYKPSEKLNNLDALNSLGILYEKGNGVKRDFIKAKEYYELSAKLNNSCALNNLGILYEKGHGVKQDFIKAKEYYELSAKLYNSDALNHLGILYEKGHGVKQDFIKAKNYYESSAKLNNSHALNNLGLLYEKGHGVKQDFIKAKDYYEQAVKLDDSNAMVNLGLLYEKGDGVKQDYNKAKEYYELSAKRFNSTAYINLGNLYYLGKGVNQSYLEAKEHYEISAEFHNSCAFLNLGILFENGYGVNKDYCMAKIYYESSAKLNNSDALNYLGNLYEKGYGVKQDFIKAKDYYESSARLNNSDALNNLGNLYEKGYGVKQDYIIARKYYELSAKLYNSDALNNLGILYEKGHGVKQDYDKAKDYYESSGILSNSKALYNLGNLYAKGLGVNQIYSLAEICFKMSANLDNSDAFYSLGNLYEKGLGVKQNIIKALNFYELSVKFNNFRATLQLGDLYLNGEFFDADIEKAIFYYTKCSSIHHQYITAKYSRECIYEFNKYQYRSSNNLGLVYLIYLHDIEKSVKYIKIAANNEYPYGQNNYGLLLLFYLNQKENASYMFEKSSKHNFALAEYNLGYLSEKNNELEKSIEYYIKASEHENEPLYFHTVNHSDKRLEISKAFIICLTNLKLVDYYLSQSNFQESKKYFIKVFEKLGNEKLNYNFNIQLFDNIIHLKNSYLYLKNFILNCPLFNLSNQPDINFKLDPYDQSLNGGIFIPYPGIFFDFSTSLDFTKELFANTIKDIIQTMTNILYTEPYSILFGRINIQRQKVNKEQIFYPLAKNINELFYEGNGIDQIIKEKINK